MGSQLLADAISRDRSLKVIQAVSSYLESAEAVSSCNFDVLLISARLDENPEKGFDVLRELKVRQPEVRAVMLLDTCKREPVITAFRAGARGIFCRDESRHTLCKCIRAVHGGQIWANRKELEFVLDALANQNVTSALNAKEFENLSNRERDVIHCLSEGLGNREIAERLQLSEHTVKNYMFHIFDKLGVSSRLELMFKIVSRGRACGTVRSDRALAFSAQADLDSVTVSSLALWRTAADQGFPAAQLALGECYRRGRVVAKDRIQAYAWFLLAAKSSDRIRVASDEARRALATEMTAAEISQAERTATELGNRATQSPVKNPRDLVA
jgi:two-component system, NarL family, nitrate/nitrite response regulator NarL